MAITFNDFVNLNLPMRPFKRDNNPPPFSTHGHKTCSNCHLRFNGCFVNGDTMGVAWTTASFAPCVIIGKYGKIEGRTDEFATMRYEWAKKNNKGFKGDIETVRCN